jgi:hypothetical protein
VVSEDVVKGWAHSSASVRTVAQMAAAAATAMGADNASPFVTRCCSADLKALARSGQLAEAAAQHAIASAAFGLLAELPVETQVERAQRMATALGAVLAQLTSAASAMGTRPDDGSGGPAEAVRTSAQVSGLLKALCELHTLGLRLATSLEWHLAIFAPAAAAAAAAALGTPISPASQSSAQMSQLVREAHAAAGATFAETQAAEKALAEGERYRSAAVALSSRCALSLLPLRSDTYPELPPSVSVAGESMHAPCGNLSVRMGGAPAA